MAFAYHNTCYLFYVEATIAASLRIVRLFSRNAAQHIQHLHLPPFPTLIHYSSIPGR
jgi:hypothetical protein